MALKKEQNFLLNKFQKFKEIILLKNQNEKLSVKYLLYSILLSVLIMLGVYFLIYYEIIDVEPRLTGFLAIVGAIPTLYLWIVKELKKEKEQEIEISKLNHSKISELNKVYIDSVKQFYDKESFIAGAFALNALIEDWEHLAKDDSSRVNEYYTRITQISSILFSKYPLEKDDELFSSLISNLFVKIAVNYPQNNQTFDFALFNFNGLNLRRANLTGANLTRANLTWAHLTGAHLTGANLTWAHLTGAHLTGANLTGANLTGANLTGANLTRAHLIGATFENIFVSRKSISTMTGIKLSQLKGMSITNENGVSERIAPSIINDLSKELIPGNGFIDSKTLKKFFS